VNEPNPYQAPAAAVADRKAADSAGHEGVGVAVTLGLLLLQGPLAVLGGVLAEAFGVRGEASMVWVFGPLLVFGATQFIFVVPVALWLRKRGKRRTVLGMWITSGVLFLLNSACFGLLFVGGLKW
jgi:hypothetical protein